MFVHSGRRVGPVRPGGGRGGRGPGERFGGGGRVGVNVRAGSTPAVLVHRILHRVRKLLEPLSPLIFIVC